MTPTMPPEVNSPTIFIIAPNGTSNVINPLYNYTFHPQPSDTDFPSYLGPVCNLTAASSNAVTGWFITDLCVHNSLAELQ